MKLEPARLGWLAIVHDNTGLSRVSFTKDARGVAEWDIDGYGIRGGYASRDLWWLWEAGFIKFTKASYPTAVIATEKGVQTLMEAGVIDWPYNPAHASEPMTARVTIPQKDAASFTNTVQGELVTIHEPYWSKVIDDLHTAEVALSPPTETPSGWTRENIVNFATWYLDERDGERPEAEIRAEVEAAIGENKNLGVSGA